MALPHAYDVTVVGGGASGLAAAIAAARAGARSLVLERDVEAALPILATGSGRCNLSNDRLDPTRYRHPDVMRTVMGAEPEQELAAFFDSLGIVTVGIEGRRYPLSRRAESVRDALLGACRRAGVELRCCCDVRGTRFDAVSDTWQLTVAVPVCQPRGRRGADFRANLRARRRELETARRETHPVQTHRVIIACGGASATCAELFGLPHIEEHPALCPLACELNGRPDALAALNGLRVEAALALERGGAHAGANDVPCGALWTETGEVLFRPYGISGIAAFNLSRRAQAGDTVALDLFPGYTDAELAELVAARSRALGDVPGALGPAWFDGLLARPLGELLSKLDGTDGLPFPRALRLAVLGTAEERVAQVRRGGIPFNAVELPQLRVHGDIAPGLFACGEALDMDADCGGFNLAWAWLSGLRAGAAAAASMRA